MTELKADVVVIGAGPAGLAAAIKAKQEGAARVMVLERDSSACSRRGVGVGRCTVRRSWRDPLSRHSQDATLPSTSRILRPTHPLGFDSSRRGTAVCIAPRDCRDGPSAILSGVASLAVLVLLLVPWCSPKIRSNRLVNPTSLRSAAYRQR